MMFQSALQFHQVGKCYHGKSGECWAVRAIDLVINSGEVVGFLGPNRAGKTTLAKLALSLCTATEGTIERFGRPASDRRTLALVGYVPEDPGFALEVSATELLTYLGALAFVPQTILKQRVPELLDEIGLADRAREPIGQFSKGMQRRLSLAQALIASPDLLVLDEPSEGLDLEGRDLLRQYVKRQRSKGRSALMISHVLSEVEALCDRAVVLVEGRKVFDGPLNELSQPGKTATSSSHHLERSLEKLYRSPAA